MGENPTILFHSGFTLLSISSYSVSLRQRYALRFHSELPKIFNFVVFSSKMRGRAFLQTLLNVSVLSKRPSFLHPHSYFLLHLYLLALSVRTLALTVHLVHGTLLLLPSVTPHSDDDRHGNRTHQHYYGCHCGSSVG